MALLSQGRTAAAQCGLFTYKSVPVIFEPPCNPRMKKLTSLRYLLSSRGPMGGKDCFQHCRLSSREVPFLVWSRESTFLFVSHFKHRTVLLTLVAFKKKSTKTNIGLLCPSLFFCPQGTTQLQTAVFFVKLQIWDPH